MLSTSQERLLRYWELELTTVQMGPWCTRIVADFGAEVIKVEAPEGDSSRYTGVPRHRGMSGTFQHNAKGKRSIALDLKRPEAKAAILRLATRCDAFASNIRPAALDLAEVAQREIFHFRRA